MMRLPLLLLPLLATLAGCGREGESSRTASNAWIRLPAVAGRPAAGYAEISATPDHKALVSVTSPSAERIEMHETLSHGAMAGMRKLDRVDVAREGEIVFEPGGRHLMLFGLDPALKAGGRAELVFHYENGGASTASARIVGAGDESPFGK